MPVTIKPIKPTKDELRRYVEFGIDHYKGNGCYVPPLIVDEIATLSPTKNPAFDFSTSCSFMAYRDGRPVGRITAIINDAYNKKTGTKTLRFGFVDFIDDAEVVDALFAAAEEWGRKRGMTEIVGPMGFTDMDPEGMLVEGFDEMVAQGYINEFHPVRIPGTEMRGVSSSSDRIAGMNIVADSIEEFNAKEKIILNSVKVIDVNGNDIMRRDLLPELRVEKH